MLSPEQLKDGIESLVEELFAEWIRDHPTMWEAVPVGDRGAIKAAFDSGVTAALLRVIGARS